jgi:hypothetical protein
MFEGISSHCPAMRQFKQKVMKCGVLKELLESRGEDDIVDS